MDVPTDPEDNVFEENSAEENVTEDTATEENNVEEQIEDVTEEKTETQVETQVTTVTKKKRRTRKSSQLVPRKKPRKSVKSVEAQPEPEPEDEEEYEVETILDHKVENGEEYYLVKWKGWSEEYDQWLSKENMSCPELIAEFHEKNGGTQTPTDENGEDDSNEQSKSDSESSDLQKYIESIWKPTHEDIEMAIKAVCSVSDKNKNNGMKGKKEEDLNKYAFMVFQKKQKLVQMERNLMMQLLTRDFRKRRADQLLQLKRWEEDINTVTCGKPVIKVENNVDLEEPPIGFTYINQCKAGTDVIIPDEPAIGCTCSDCNEGQKSCCGALSGGVAVYTKAGRLKVEVGTPIYECNSRCLCQEDCVNRVVQRGSKLKFCIFRTSNGRGWGVKAMELIRKNSFVIEYVGEVITNEEAERRGVQYDSEGRTYLFDLDFNDTDCLYAVDAAHEGNVSHFINHSCDPNLAVFAVWANCLDPNLPRLALFAQRDIHSGEELTFDYASSKQTENSNNLGVSSKAKADDDQVAPKNECRCGASTCRKIMFSLPENQVIPPFQMAE